MKLKLQSEGETLFEVESEDVSAEITIGRSHECTWCLPKTDEKVSRRHAVIFRRDDQIVIRDLQSANGTYCNGERITERIIRPGDSFTIGNCSMDVEKGPGSSVAGTPHVIVCSGDMRGRRIPIGAIFSIGSDPEASFTIPDPLVSRLHAEIREDQGQYFLRDLGSRNGTALNGRAVKAEDVAKLKGGDRVYVAHYCLRFDDGSLHRHRLIYGGAAAAAVVAVFAFAIALHSCRPTPDRLVKRAYAFAAEEQLDKALQCIEKVERSELGEPEASAVAEATERIELWKTTRSGYDRLCASAESGNGDRCRDLLTDMDVKNPDAWNWAPSGAQYMKRAGTIAGLLEAGDRVKRLLDADTFLPEELGSAQEELHRQLAAARLAKSPPDLGALVRDAEATLQQLTSRANDGRFFAGLASLTTWPPDFSGAEGSLRTAAEHESASVRQHASSLLPALLQLSKAMDVYRSIESELMKLNDASVMETDVTLPPAEQFSDARMRACRQAIADRAARLRECAKALAAVRAFMPAGDSVVAELTAWQDERAVQDVLSCDSLRLPLPARGRKEPVGQYDRYLGIENFHRFCTVDLARQMDLSPLVTPFPTMVARTGKFFATARGLVSAVETMGGTEWASGPLAVLHRRCLAAQNEQLRIVEQMASNAKTMSGRQALIAAGIALHLGADCDLPLADMTDLRDRAVEILRELQARIREKRQEYRDAAGDQKRVIGQQILDAGIPGDPVVDRVRENLAFGPGGR